VSFLFVLAGRFKLRLRSLKRDRRIIRQAKAAGAWWRLDALGGRALELRAWQQYRLKRKPGETDACLRLRMQGAALDEIAKRDYSTARLPGESNKELRERLHRIIDERSGRLPKHE
jgi:hypothetical protein